MSDAGNLLWLIPGLPLLGVVLAALFGWNRKLSHLSHLPVVLGSAMGFAVTGRIDTPDLPAGWCLRREPD